MTQPEHCNARGFDFLLFGILNVIVAQEALLERGLQTLSEMKPFVPYKWRYLHLFGDQKPHFYGLMAPMPSWLQYTV